MTSLLLTLSAFLSLTEAVFYPPVSPFDVNPEELYQFINQQQPIRTAALQEPRVCGLAEQERVKECAAPLYKLGAFTDVSQSLGWDGIIFRTKAYFNDVCDNFFLFDVCIEPYKDTCFAAGSARFKYDAAIKVLDFLCRDGYGEMMRNFECFTRTLTRAEMMQCQAELVSDTRKLPQISSLNATGEIALCGAMHNYIDCVKYPVRYECGYRAWQLVKELIVRPTNALLPSCQLNSATSSGILSVFTMMMTSLFF